MSGEAASFRRDRRLRRRLLSTLRLAISSPLGGLRGRSLRDLVEELSPPGQGFESDQHCLSLARDLVHAELATEESLPRRRGQLDGLDYRLYRITDRGTQLLAEAIPPHPLVDDERVVGEEA